MFSSVPNTQFTFGQVKYLVCRVLVGSSIPILAGDLTKPANQNRSGETFLVIGFVVANALVLLFLFPLSIACQ